MAVLVEVNGPAGIVNSFELDTGSDVGRLELGTVTLPLVLVESGVNGDFGGAGGDFLPVIVACE